MPKHLKHQTSNLKHPQPCSVQGCTFPGLIHLGEETYCLRHAAQKLGGQVTVTTHLDRVATPTCKSTTQTLSY